MLFSLLWQIVELGGLESNEQNWAWLCVLYFRTYSG